MISSFHWPLTDLHYSTPTPSIPPLVEPPRLLGNVRPLSASVTRRRFQAPGESLWGTASVNLSGGSVAFWGLIGRTAVWQPEVKGSVPPPTLSTLLMDANLKSQDIGWFSKSLTMRLQEDKWVRKMRFNATFTAAERRAGGAVWLTLKLNKIPAPCEAPDKFLFYKWSFLLSSS